MEQSPALKIQERMKAAAEKEAKQDALSLSERIGQLFPAIGFALVIVFVAVHQTTPTGFFTESSETLQPPYSAPRSHSAS